ncbi:hypothetical protein [Nocardia farcinica]|uniref:hypothetical protein n=1 Tax=Nocardia farcinica TaxID=37329 RepID=UPI0018937792|nr:hypothetical protein [Nocardia farcinica]MBF6440688.1 hypothetical protein [Nocardia farcinica]MBF6523723.1 hypothetical protein [Nocardia farcinica]MBF6538392.1 hypothetical protein [Nocardia farcinica]
MTEPATTVRTLTGAVRQQPWEYDRAPQTTTVTTGRPVAVVWGVHARVRLLGRLR